MAAAAAASDKLPTTTGSDASRNNTVFGFNRLSLLRQIGLMVGLAASVALGLAVVLWAREPNMQPLFTDITQMDINEVTQVLNTADIAFRVEPRTGALLVASDQVYNARLKLAAAGITDDRTNGYELLDKEQGLGTSQFMETARYRRGLEGELSRTIASLRNVRTARVHLAIPKSSVFVRDTRKATASVFVEVFSGQRLAEEQVSSIVNLVASSVPELNKDDVTVVDQRGNLLSQTDVKSDARRIAEEFDYTRRLEDVLSRRVSGLLESVVGSGRYRAEVSADVDFTAVEAAEELFNPTQQAIRSEQTLEEQRVAGTQGGIPGALSNQPPGNATAPEVATGGGPSTAATDTTGRDVRSQTTRNFEVDRTVSYTKKQAGEVRRLTVAVAIDDVRKVNPETGEATATPWTEAELQRLTVLVRDAVGFNPARGDSVNVVNTPFFIEEEVAFEEAKFWEQAWFWDLMKQVLAGLVVLILVLTLVRPTLKNLSTTGREGRDLALAGDSDGMAELERLGSDLPSALGGGDEFLLPGASEGYDKQMNALKGLVAEDPARVAQVVRQWVNSDD